jgi:lysophospholipase L1-like esterase
MPHSHRPLLLIAALILTLSPALLVAGDATLPHTAIPVENGTQWNDPKAHQDYIRIAKEDKTDLVFFGDSITAGWGWGGNGQVWDMYFKPLKAAHFGIGGDKTENLLWRMQNGELDGLHAKLVVLLIGTNNGGDSAEDVATGISTILAELHTRMAAAKVLLLGILPSGEKPNPQREKNARTNALVAKHADGTHIVYLDIGGKFLGPDQSISKEVMGDFLHPSTKGYQIFAESIIAQVKKMLP